MLIEFTYKTYMSDVPKLYAEQKMHSRRWHELFERPEPEQPEQTGDEVAAQLIADMGLTIKGK